MGAGKPKALETAEAPAPVGPSVTRTRVYTEGEAPPAVPERPPVVEGEVAPEAPAPAVPEPTSAGITPETPLNKAAEARLTEAASEGVPLTRGQATQEFGIQDTEQILKSAVGPEADAARTFLQEQAEAIKGAVEKFKASVSDQTLTGAERGELVKESLRELRDAGKKGVAELYNQARELGGKDFVLDTEDFVKTAKNFLIDAGTSDVVKNVLKQELARYGLIGKVKTLKSGGTMNELGETVVVLDDGTNIKFAGPQEQLSIGNAEKLNQALNRQYLQDPHSVGALKRSLDDAVEKFVQEGASGEAGEVQQALKAARAAYQQQKKTFSAKDIIQRLIDFKKGTTTDAVLPERAIPSILTGGPEAVSNLKRIKAILLANPTEKSKAAWKAIKGEVIGSLFDKAYTVNANVGGGQVGVISGAKLRTAIEKFGRDRLKDILDPAEMKQLEKLERIIGNATIPISGTTNPSGTAARIVRFFSGAGKTVAHAVPFGSVVMAEAKTLLAKIKQRETLTQMTSYTKEAAKVEGTKAAPGASKMETIKDKADELGNDIIQGFLDLAPKVVVPVVEQKREKK